MADLERTDLDVPIRKRQKA